MVGFVLQKYGFFNVEAVSHVQLGVSNSNMAAKSENIIKVKKIIQKS